uniref:ornithine decarboxylase n=1 Tax=Phallusia mammillata TaxID=59560 RepID=A0A6F9D6E5_9ASCI|nr:ornithine decarboxylase [Phallusia mammillata]
MKDTPSPTYVELLNDFNIEKFVQSQLADSFDHGDAEDPFLVCDLGDVVAKHQRWKTEFPRVHPHYAIKCNTDTVLLKTMMALGTGFDCASKVEIKKMLELGASPERIIFANPCKQKSHIVYAKEQGVKLVVFDNENELFKMKKLYPDAQLVLRIQTDDSASICRFSMKYGADPEACPQLIDIARNLNLNVVGISFHVGSGCQDVNAFVKALQNSRKLFDYAKTVGYDFNLLDIGGGFPGTKDVDLTFEKITSVVNFQLHQLFPSKQFPHVNVIAEPGRYYAASAFTLVTNVIATRQVARDIPAEGYSDSIDSVRNGVTPTANEERAYMYYINDGLYGSFNCLFFDHAKVTPTLLDVSAKQSKFSSSIWGPTCDGLDRIIEHMLMPQLNTGDWIVWKDMGAYTIAAGSSFNGFKTQKVYYHISDEKRDLLTKLADTKVKGVEFSCFASSMCCQANKKIQNLTKKEAAPKDPNPIGENTEQPIPVYM